MSDPKVAPWVDSLRESYAARRWIVLTDAIAPGVSLAQALRALGARDVQLVAARRGAGAQSADALAREPLVIGAPESADVMQGIRDYFAAVGAPGDEIRRALDAFDPAREALVLGPLFDDGRPFAGRAKFGRRLEAWRALEDKIAIERVWREAGVALAPSRVCAGLDRAALGAAHAELDRGEGTVWALDNTEGFHGGAARTYPVRDGAALKEALSIAGGAELVRVQPFLVGVPCSIHALVDARGVYPLRPCEMHIALERDSKRFVYAKYGNVWEPSARRAREMRDAVERTASWLRERLGYRGSFSLDGVATRTGFFPTEINPRFGAAMGCYQHLVPDVPLRLLDAAVAQGERDFSLGAFVELLLERSERDRYAAGMALCPGSLGDEERRYTFDGANLTCARAPDEELEEGAIASVRVSPMGAKSFVFVKPRVDSIPAGRPTGPLVFSALNALANAQPSLALSRASSLAEQNDEVSA